ncbi:MAG: RNA polymerase factor sigma-54 [Halofilum sp. (in: g-proteobacteria)]|nr:RNA polymerase factor sigma-54 [Halofilum sp. (in: g-proteobacteria)]
MKQSLQLRVSQQLTMTPQLQQAIRLLQLSTIDLQTEIQECLESNPMLELEEDSPDSPAESADDDYVTAQAPESDSEEGSAVDASDDGMEEDFSSLWRGSAPMDGEGVDFLETRSNGADSLQDHLLEQLHLSSVGERDRTIATAIIESVRDDGYLDGELDDIIQGIGNELSEIEPDEAEAVLHMVQQFDPAGVAARGPQECMALQLRLVPEDTPGLELATRIVESHLELLAAHDFAGLQRALKVKRPELEQAVTVIQSLDPHPGSQISEETARYIVPDVFVRKENGVWRVRLNPDIAPRLRVSQAYSELVKRADRSADNTFLRDHLQEARWFIRSLQSRNETLLRVATSIVEKQRAFLEYGEEAMKPLVLRDIAEQLDMHESTVSRVTTEKYMHTPRGVLEFKYFFSSHVGTADGGECSATAIRAMVRKLVAGEDQRKPLSDQKIAAMLVDQGINVARRTVAKYRESMAIPPSNERKRLG